MALTGDSWCSEKHNGKILRLLIFRTHVSEDFGTQKVICANEEVKHFSADCSESLHHAHVPADGTARGTKARSVQERIRV